MHGRKESAMPDDNGTVCTYHCALLWRFRLGRPQRAGGRRKQRLCCGRQRCVRSPQGARPCKPIAPRAAASPSIRAFRLNPTGTVCAPGARRAIGGDEGQSDGHAGEPWRLDLRAPYHGVTTTTATQATDSRESQMCVALHEPCTYIEVIVIHSRSSLYNCVFHVCLAV